MADSQKYWDKTAERYAKSPVSDEATYQRKLEETQGCLRGEMRILEFGCGTGTTAVHHAPHVAHIDAIDISQNMLDIGQRKADEAGVSNITFTRGTLREFQAPPESLDAVLGLNVLHLLPDRISVIEEVARILKPGGIFVSSTVCLAGSTLRFIRYIAPLAKLIGLMPDLFIFSESELADEIRSAGFEIERQWHHAKDGIAVFIIARKAQPAA
ncbi:MAG: class I SAM-dependent methyltransferase [Gammaproteobacteria bacterium]|nr:MAG: class I SAM-dependent methyltransferase [Gammaproteobacteria bacterium]